MLAGNQSNPLSKLSWFNKGKAIVLLGPRQVGKTTLCKELIHQYPGSHYITCDDPTIIQTLENHSRGWI